MGRWDKRVLSSAVNAGDLLTLATRELTIRQHASAITAQRTALMNQAETLSVHAPTINNLNASVSISGDLSSVEQAIALSDKYIYCVNKINFALSCISQNQSDIRSRRDYAAVLRPIFESKFTDNSINKYGYVCIMQGTTGLNDPLGKVYFFEADKTQDGVNSYQGDYAYLNQLRSDSEKRINSFFISFRQNKPAQQNVYNIIAYPWNNGIKISIIVSTPCLLNSGTYINILSGFNLTPILPVYDTLSKLPATYLTYTAQIQVAFNNFSGSESDNRTVYQYGAVAKFNTLKVISSAEYPSWGGKLISECYIPGSNINMPNIISQINTELNSNYTGMQAGEIVMVQYAVGDEYYTGVIKMLEIDGYGLCYKIAQININDIISDAASLNGDVSVHGNLNVLRYDNEPIITTDNVRRTTTFHDKVGINQHAYEVDALLDIDNLTKQEILALFTRSAPDAANSSDIMNIIRTNTSTVSAIPGLFGNGQPLFDYKDQCSVFTSKLDYIITKSDITGIRDFDINAWSAGTFARIQQLVKEAKQMSSEYAAANDNSFMFTFVELFSNSNLSWFFTTIKAIIRSNALIFVLTKIDVTNIMVDPSYTGILTRIVDYISRINRNLNYNVLLVKNAAFYTSNNPANAFKIADFDNAKQNNPFFSRGFDLLSESYMFFYETSANKTYKYHGAHNEWSGVSGYDCWLSSLNAGDVLEDITKQQLMKYNGLQNGNFCVNYVWAGFQKIAFVHRTIIGGKEYIIGSGVNIISILNKSLKVRGETKLTGDFIVDDAHDNVIFKVDNVNKTISNAYNVGIGLTTPQAMLDVKDTSIQDVIDEFAVRTGQLKLMNPILDAMRLSGFNDVTQSYNLTQDPTYKQYTVVYKINTSTLYAEDVTVVHHQLHTAWKQKTLAAILSDANEIANRSLIQNTITFLQATLEVEMIFDGNYFTRIFDHPVYGATNVGHAIVKSGTNIYIYTHNTSLLNYNIRHTLSKSVTKLFETREYTTRARSNVWRNVKSVTPVINLQEGLNTLNSLTQRNSDIKKSIYKVVFDVTDPVNPAKIYVTDVPSFDITVLTNTGPALSTKPNDIIQKFIHMINATMKAYGDNTKPTYGFKLGHLLSVVYEDNRNDYMAVSRCYGVAGNIVTLFVPEFSLQDVLKPALSVVGDTKVTGDLIISDATENFVSIDPVQKFVGINTDDRIINYPDRKYTTTTNADDPLIGKYDAKYHVHVKGKTYPVMVSERIQEVSAFENTPKPQYFGTCSGFTVKRTSELYDFTQIVTNATTQNTNEALDSVTKVKYGPDVSFEVCDKTSRTVELGNVQMTIDQTETLNGTTYLKGGFGVQVIDPPATPTDLSTNRNIMYVDNEGTLFINKINLGGKELSVDASGVLKWGGKAVHVDL
jgi:hypothetical protein